MTARELATEHLGTDYYSDPYAAHARLRARGPVTPVVLPGGMPAWLITGYAEARAALADPRFRKNMPGWQPAPGSVAGLLGVHMLDSDPPDHGRLRRLVNKAFTARRVDGLRPRISAITGALLDGLAGRGEVDLLASFAFPLPITVICELLGVPVADQDDFRTWTATAVADDAPAELARAHGTAMTSYLVALIEAKRRDPADDLLSALIAARDDADRLSEAELVSMIFLLLVAGHETTVNLIASGVLALLLNPAELARLRAFGSDPALIGGAVEEMLRYVNPVSNATFRCAVEPVELGGVRIGRGDAVFVALSGANRDPARFGAPDRLDLGRDTAGHLAFGHGIHYCVGAPLARLEAEIAFTRLLERFGGIRLAVPPESLRWRPSSLIHGLESLPVRLAPAGAAEPAGGIPVRWDA
jgi:cytochrome P450